MSDGNPDVMATLAGLAEGSPVAELRRQRPDVVRHLQGSDDAIFAPAHHGGFTRPEREGAAKRSSLMSTASPWRPTARRKPISTVCSPPA